MTHRRNFQPTTSIHHLPVYRQHQNHISFLAELLLDSSSSLTSKYVNQLKFSFTSSILLQTPSSIPPLPMVALEYHNCNTESLASFYFASRSSATLRITLLLPFLPPTKSKPFAPNACPSSTPTKADLRKRIDKQSRQNIYSTVDGKCLQETRKFPQANQWIRGGIT